jgi:hypothetical protein
MVQGDDVVKGYYMMQGDDTMQEYDIDFNIPKSVSFPCIISYPSTIGILVDIHIYVHT